MQWLEDKNGNKCSVEYFGSIEKAQKALDSLKNSYNCVNCSDCSRCLRCWGCSDCSRCSDCSDCSRCWDCSRCSRCSYCSRCWGCWDCSRCSRCSYCSRCSRCSGCSDCSRCWDCSRCSRCSGCLGKKEEKREPTFQVIPKIKDIHKEIFKAVTTKPESLEMGTWHTCETTHCRAGWVVALAGKEGKKLESFFNTELAAMLIYRESGYRINPARFYDSKEDAMADIKRLAKKA